MTARLLVTGSREFTAAHIMHDALGAAIADLGPNLTLVHGAAKGADEIADVLAPTFGLSVERWPAAWREHGRAAGPMRNQAMVDAGADLCVALLVAGLVCRGTRDCARRAQAAGIPVRWYTQGGA